MITAIGTFDDHLNQLRTFYTDSKQPIQAGHVLALFQDVELVLLNLAVLEKRLEQTTAQTVLH